MDLPTIIESHKTIDNKVLYKTGDIAQMLLCSSDPEEEGTEEKVSVDQMTAAKKKELYKMFMYNHGGTGLGCEGVCVKWKMLL